MVSFFKPMAEGGREHPRERYPVTGSAILLYGPPAAGKSSLARDLLTRHRAIGAEPAILYLGTDPLRETISGKTYLPTARSVVYDGVLALLSSALRNGHHVLVDGNYLDAEHRDRLVSVVEECQARLLKVLVSCRLEVGLRRNGARMPSERVPDLYLHEVYGRLKDARQAADLCFDSEENLAGRESELLTWLLGAPPPDPPESTAEWLKQGQRRTLAAGEAVWRGGQPSTEVIMLLDGELEVVREHEDQPSVVINRLSQGAVAGDLSSLDGSPHSATVRAICPSVIVSLQATHFRALLRREPDLLDRVLEGMAGRIRSLSGKASTASVDLLTGLGNRRMLEDLWPHLAASAERDGQPLTVALFDVDRFKGINDTFGHHVGDVVLREISCLLRNSIPDPGICLRYGGDEFVLFLPGWNNHDALELMQNFAQKVRSTPLALDEGVGLQATVSVGLATYPQPVSSTADLFGKADEAAYVSKGEGRDRVTAYQPEPR
jgi:diguanylate cyclase (GGDEF)-like protein